MNIKKYSDSRINTAITHKVGDIAGGVTVATSDLTNNTIDEGTPIGIDTATGLYHVVKSAVATVGANTIATTYTVKKGHNLRVGDIITVGVGKKAYAITSIATNSSDSTSDDITVGTTLGSTVAVGGVLYQANAEATGNTSVLKYEPKAIVGESYRFNNGDNVHVNAWVLGVIKAECVPFVGSDIQGKLKGIMFV